MLLLFAGTVRWRPGPGSSAPVFPRWRRWRSWWSGCCPWLWPCPRPSASTWWPSTTRTPPLRPACCSPRRPSWPWVTVCVFMCFLLSQKQVSWCLMGPYRTAVLLWPGIIISVQMILVKHVMYELNLSFAQKVQRLSGFKQLIPRRWWREVLHWGRVRAAGLLWVMDGLWGGNKRTLMICSGVAGRFSLTLMVYNIISCLCRQVVTKHSLLRHSGLIQGQLAACRLLSVQ